jgi:hypothetical protein
LWEYQEAGAAGCACEFGVEAGELVAAWINLMDCECACELYGVVCAQRVACCFLRGCDEQWLGQRDDRKARVTVGSAVEVALERTDESGCGFVVEFVGAGLAPQCGGDLDAGER